VWQADPSITCLLVGSDLPNHLRRMAGDRVRVLGHVADLGADVLDRVRLTVAPLRFGAGVKGKVLESLAAGVPCIMSPVAAEGLSLPADLKALVGQDEAGLAALICHLNGNAKAHGRAADAGLAFMRAACSEAAVEQALLAAIEGRRVQATVTG
jgi:glycosyltransferase involved in cell wall biosynthesis